MEKRYVEINSSKKEEIQGTFAPYYGDYYDSKKSDLFIEPLMVYSDYSGSTVERSNLEYWETEYSDTRGTVWETITGGHGTRAVVLSESFLTEEMKEDLERLENYPVFCDEAMSNLEVQLQGEQWEQFYKDDFLVGVAENLKISFPGDTDSEGFEALLYDLFNAVAERNNEYWRCEDAVSAYIDLESLIQDTRLDDFREWDVPFNMDIAECIDPLILKYRDKALAAISLGESETAVTWVYMARGAHSSALAVDPDYNCPVDIDRLYDRIGLADGRH